MHHLQAVFALVTWANFTLGFVRVGQEGTFLGLDQPRRLMGAFPPDTVDSLSDTLTRRLLTSEDPTQTRLLFLNSRLGNLSISRTTVGPSTIAGRGLFAAVDCRKGDLLTCYPGDGLIFTPEAAGWSMQWGSHVQKADRKTVNDLADSMFGYILFVDDDYGILGLADYDDNPNYLGHFANDGATTLPTCEADLAPYVLDSNSVRNAMHQGISGDCHMITVATRDIGKGEEIFVTYGPEYWREQPSFVGNESTRLNSDNGRRDSRKRGTGFG